MTVRLVALVVSLLVIIVIISLLFQPHPSQLSLKINSDLLLERIARLSTEAESLFTRREYDSSFSNYNLALKLASDSPENLDSAITLIYSKMASCHHKKYDYALADSCWSRAITTRKATDSCSRTELANDLKSLGDLCTLLGQMDRAKTVLERALDIEKSLYGEDSHKIVDCLNRLASHARKTGNLGEAKAIRLKGLKILEESNDVDSPDEEILKGLACQYSLLRMDVEAEKCYRDRLRLTAQKYGRNNKEAAKAMLDLCYSIYQLDRVKGTSMLEQAYELAKSVYGAEDCFTNLILMGIGSSRRILSEYTKAESLKIQALAIAENMRGYYDNEIANILIELGIICVNLAQYERARTYLGRATALLGTQSQIPSSPLALTLNWYGNIAKDLGRLSDAESLYTESLRMRTFVEGPAGPNLAEAYNNLGTIRLMLKKHPEAETCFTKALKLREDEFDSNFAYLDHSLVGLGKVYNAVGRFSEAISVFERAARICRLSYQPDHEHSAWIAEGEGDSYRGLGKYKEADSCYQKALQILARIFVESHPSKTPLLQKQALLYSSVGGLPRALVAYRQLLQMRQNLLFDVFAYLSDEQQMQFLHENPVIIHSLLSFALLHDTPQTRDLAMEMVLRGKTATLDAATTEKRNAHCSPDEDIREALGSRFRVRSTISELTLASWRTGLRDLYSDSLKMLRQKDDSLDIQLSSCSGDITSRRVTVGQVAAGLPKDSKLLEYVWYVPYDFSVDRPDSIKEGMPRYLAMILNNRGKTSMRDLGLTATIDSLVLAVRKALYKQGTLRQHYLPEESKEQLANASRRLYNLVWAPLAADLQGCDRVLVAPDGQLNLVPFEILSDVNNKYVIENYRISYLSSGRDLISSDKMSENTGMALLISNPNFELPRKESPGMDSGQLRNGLSGASQQFGQTRGLRGGLIRQFDPLPQTQSEVIAIKQALETEMKSAIVSLTGDSATEENLYNYAKSPRILHLATHGFFLEDETPHADEDMEGSLIGSGLAMAGANRMTTRGAMQADSSDGILTALEVLGMDLNGTDIAFLSACETAVGAVRNGEGVFGLRRAFQVAGVKSLVMSLWKVPDEHTRELVTYFYSDWLRGLTKSEALRRSALKILEFHRERDGTSNPFYWGAFVLSGNPN